MAANWIKIRNEYINGNISYSKLAEKHGVNYYTLQDKARKEKWFEKKKMQHEKIAEKTLQKSAEKIIEQESDLASEINSAAVELLSKLRIAIQQTDVFIERTKLKVPKKVKDEKTGETYTAWQENENIKLSKKDGMNAATIKQLASALKDLQAVQIGAKGESVQESPNINITISAATQEDLEEDTD